MNAHHHHDHHHSVATDAAPGDDVKPDRNGAGPQDTETIYTCPMHPEIRRLAPGNCPICGMALEPVMPTLDEDQNPELEDFSRRFWWTLPFTVVGVVLAIGGHRFVPVAAPTMSWTELVLSTPVVLWAGWPFFVRCVAIAVAPFDEAEVLRLAASADQGSEHPLANAIVDAAHEKGLQLAKPDTFESSTGIGVRATIEGHQIALGNTRLLEDAGADPTPLASQAESLRSDGASVIYLAVDGRLAGILAVTDPVKDSTPDAIRVLHEAGIRVVMATGDGHTTAKAVANRLGIDEVHGEVRPKDKADLVARLQAEGRRVAMAGDGINDAPALARADVGIAMGTGTDVAMNSSQVTLVKGDLRGIARARQISQATVRNMYENLVFALIYNALGVPIAAGVLYPFFGILLSPLIAALAMSLSSVSVVGNALRLRKV